MLNEDGYRPSREDGGQTTTLVPITAESLPQFDLLEFKTKDHANARSRGNPRLVLTAVLFRPRQATTVAQRAANTETACY